MIYVAGIAFRWNSNRAAGEERPVASRQAPAPIRPLRQEGQPRAQDRRLQFVETRVHGARLIVAITAALASITQASKAIRQSGVVRDDGATIAERAEILGRIETERAGGANRADRPACRRREVRLTAVLDDWQRVTPRDRLNGRHVGRVSVEVHRE